MYAARRFLPKTIFADFIIELYVLKMPVSEMEQAFFYGFFTKMSLTFSSGEQTCGLLR